jgi:hypothetical protein
LVKAGSEFLGENSHVRLVGDFKMAPGYFVNVDAARSKAAPAQLGIVHRQPGT